MSVKGIGTDIVAVSRIEAAVSRQPSFAARILTEHELEQFQTVREPARLLAKRFAAKEACLKALGTGLAKGITWHDLEVRHTDAGQPWIALSGMARQRADDLGVAEVQLSISDEAEYAVAFVVLV